MLLIGLAAAVFSLFSPQAAGAEPSLEAIMAPAITPNDAAAFCFAPANRQPGERDRDCQYRALREDAARVARNDGLRWRCGRQAAAPGETVEQCAARILIAERAAAEAARVARAEAAEKERVAGASDFDALFAEAGPPPGPASSPPPPPAPPRQNCRRETTTYPNGAGGSVSWICGNDDTLGDQLREMLRPR